MTLRIHLARPLLALAGALALALAPAARAADFPEATVKMILPFAPGTGGDVLLRLIAEQLQVKWSQPVIVDYKPGASTVVGTDFIAKSKPDGYTIGLAGANLAVNPLFFKKLPYATTDVVGVTQMVDIQMAIAARPDAPFNTLPEMIAYAKANPGKMNYGLPGLGATYLGIEAMKRAAGFDMTHVNFKGSSEAHTEVIGGRIDVVVDPLQSLLPYITSGRMKLITTLGDKRQPGYEKYPALGETFPGMNVSPYLGLVAPAGTPKDVVRKLNAGIVAALQTPDVKKRIEALGMSVVASSPEQFDTLIRGDVAKFAKVAAELKIVPE